jgi:hypothetical protein
MGRQGNGINSAGGGAANNGERVNGVGGQYLGERLQHPHLICGACATAGQNKCRATHTALIDLKENVTSLNALRATCKKIKSTIVLLHQCLCCDLYFLVASNTFID